MFPHPDDHCPWSPWGSDMGPGIWCWLPPVQLCCVQSLGHVWLFGTPWTAAGQTSLSFTVSWSSLKLMSIQLVMPSNHLILCHPLLLLPSIFPSIRVFSNSQLFTSCGQSIETSSLASVLPMNIQDWFPLGWTSWILQSKGLLRVFSNTTVQKHQFFSTQFSYGPTHLYITPGKPKLWLDGP